jgi:uncharacterized protein with von Willebrand factor type A (vWA) domain
MSRGDAVTRKLVTFGRILREAGMEVGPGRLQDAMRGLALVDLADRDQVYHALRCTLVSRHDHLAVFDAAFLAFWEGEPHRLGQPAPVAVPELRPPGEPGASDPDDDGEEASEDDVHGVSAADQEVLRHRDFAGMSAD